MIRLDGIYMRIKFSFLDIISIYDTVRCVARFRGVFPFRGNDDRPNDRSRLNVYRVGFTIGSTRSFDGEEVAPTDGRKKKKSPSPIHLRSWCPSKLNGQTDFLRASSMEDQDNDGQT